MKDYPLKPYMGHIDESVRPSGESRKWYPFDCPESYAEYLKRPNLDEIPDSYRLDDGWEYHFNKARFRGEEFDFDAKKRIAVCGCSNTFGLGIKWEQTFAYQFKRRYAEQHNLKEDEVNLLNFAECGASNDYIARTLLMQFGGFRPDFVLINFTFQTRKEYVDGDSIEVVGPWTHLDTPHEPSMDYFAYFTNEIGFINSVKNMLLIQYYCQANDIPYLFAWTDGRNLKDPEYMSNPVCKAYVDQLDKTYLADFTLQFDSAARENFHPGPKVNEDFAARLFDLYQQVHGN
jgi:hypothetical protein